MRVVSERQNGTDGMIDPVAWQWGGCCV